jgi:hypothetical protein
VEPKTKINFEVTLKDGHIVKVTYNPDFMNHLEFRGNISETGYQSEFPFVYNTHPSIDEVKKLAGEMAQILYDNNPTRFGKSQSLF